jgi:DNA-binding NarL/FixJ family response regulator
MGPIQVMLVDDNLTFLRILSDFLREEEEVLVVGTAGSGEEALAKAQGLQPQVILLDLAMPGMGGLAAIPQIKQMLPNTAVIALTVLDTNGYRDAALAAGADEFVAKANLSTDLLPAIRRAARSDRSPESGNRGVEAERGAWHRRTKHA